MYDIITADQPKGSEANVKAEIKLYKGTLRIFVDGEILPPDAYITYFTENNCYSDFADAGYKLFSLPVFFSSKTINEISQAPCLPRLCSAVA